MPILAEFSPATGGKHVTVIPLPATFNPMELLTLSDSDLKLIAEKIDRLTQLIARAVPAEQDVPDFDSAEAFVWNPKGQHLPARRTCESR